MPNKSFLGFEVEGSYSKYSDGMVEQYPIEDLRPILTDMINDPKVISFGWTQYTPYFNDGDACVFHANCIWVRTTDNDQGSSIYEDNDYNYQYEVRSIAWRNEPKSPEHHIALEKAIGGGHFNNALIEYFGDPATVTFNNSKGLFQIEYYDHD